MIASDLLRLPRVRGCSYDEAIIFIATQSRQIKQKEIRFYRTPIFAVVNFFFGHPRKKSDAKQIRDEEYKI